MTLAYPSAAIPVAGKYRTVDLAHAPYRYRHGWIPLAGQIVVEKRQITGSPVGTKIKPKSQAVGFEKKADNRWVNSGSGVTFSDDELFEASTSLEDPLEIVSVPATKQGLTLKFPDGSTLNTAKPAAADVPDASLTKDINIGDKISGDLLLQVPKGHAIAHAAPPAADWISNGDGTFYSPILGDKPGSSSKLNPEGLFVYKGLATEEKVKPVDIHEIATLSKSALAVMKQGKIVQSSQQVETGHYWHKDASGKWVEKGPKGYAGYASYSDQDLFDLQSEPGGALHVGVTPKAKGKAKAKPATPARQLPSATEDAAHDIYPRDKLLADEGTFKATNGNDLSDHVSITSEPEDFNAYQVQRYTQEWASEINGQLRKGKVGHYNKDAVLAMDASMQRLKQDTVLFRGVPPVAFGIDPASPHSPEDTQNYLRGMVGKILHDEGYMSTTISKDAVNVKHAPIIIKILAPKGTKGIWAQPHSSFQEEREIILHRGASYRVKSVHSARAADGSLQFVVCGEVVSAANGGK